MRRLVLAAALALLAAGCGGDGITLPSNDPVTITVAEPESAPRSCANPEAGYVVEFPGSWHTNAGGENGCTLFHPSGFEVPERPEELLVAISLRRENAPFSVVTAYGDDVRVEELELDGRRARRAEYVTAGDALLPPGLRVYEVVIDLGGGTLIATTRDVGEGLPFADAKQVLDRMVETLELS